MSVDFGKMQVIFLDAVERHRPEDWDAYLHQACAGDEELRRQVSRLLKAHREASSSRFAGYALRVAAHGSLF